MAAWLREAVITWVILAATVIPSAFFYTHLRGMGADDVTAWSGTVALICLILIPVKALRGV